MSTNDWRNKELNGLLNERWGFSMDLSKLNESKEITHMCALKVTHKRTGKEGHPIKHTLSEAGEISHYTVEFDDVIVENISVENLDILVQKEHSHKRDDEKDHDKNKMVVSEDDLEEEAKPDFLDLDKDGDKEESMKDAAEDAKQMKEEEMPLVDTDAEMDNVEIIDEPQSMDDSAMTLEKIIDEMTVEQLKAALAMKQGDM
jgi:hypothetical protein